MPTVTIAAPRAPSPSSVEEGMLPPGEARPRWFYSHFPTGWEFVEGADGGFLPILDEQISTAGVNGVRAVLDRNGRPIGVDDAPLRTGLARKGAVILEPTDHRLGPWKNYVRAYPCVGGGKAWVFAVERTPGKVEGVTYTILGNGAAVAHDAAALFREFRRWLVDNGIIPQIPQPVYVQLMEVERTALERTINAATSNPHLAAGVKARQDRIKRMEKAWAALTESLSVTPSARLTMPVSE
jgi:hypothetical protein